MGVSMKKLSWAKNFGKNLAKRMAVTVAAAALAVYALTGCGADSNSGRVQNMVSEDMAPADTGSGGSNAMPSAAGASYPMEEGEAATMESSAGEGSSLESNRKLIKTVDMDVETREFEAMMGALETQVQELGGYIENMETYNGSSYSDYTGSRWANLTIRIPKEKLGGFLKSVSEIGNVIRRSDSVEDVTLTYVDMASRRDALRVEQERLMSFLEKAESIEDIITIESRLSEVRYELESMESQLRTMDNQVDYSTVHLAVNEVRELTPVEEKSDLQRAADGFMDSIEDIVYGFKEFLIDFVSFIPHLVVWVVIITAAILLIKLHYRRSVARKAKKSEKDRTGRNEDANE